jgi:hypothetical protein
MSGNGSAYVGNISLVAGTFSLNATEALNPNAMGNISFNGGTLQFTSRFRNDLSGNFS